jgi:hypothetical protein
LKDHYLLKNDNYDTKFQYIFEGIPLVRDE